MKNGNLNETEKAQRNLKAMGISGILIFALVLIIYAAAILIGYGKAKKSMNREDAKRLAKNAVRSFYRFLDAGIGLTLPPMMWPSSFIRAYNHIGDTFDRAYDDFEALYSGQK